MINTLEEANQACWRYGEINWTEICREYELSESFMREHSDKIHWPIISKYQKLSESFIEEFSDKLNWYFLCRYQKVSKGFLIKHLDKFNIIWTNDNKLISNEIKEEIKLIKKLTQ